MLGWVVLDQVVLVQVVLGRVVLSWVVFGRTDCPQPVCARVGQKNKILYDL